MSRRATSPNAASRFASPRLAEPKSDAAKWARSQWNGEVETLSDSDRGAPLLIDACSEQA